MTRSKEEKIALVEQYIQAYNRNDTAKLVTTLHPNVRFEHWNNDQLVLQLEGIEAFQTQFEETQKLFYKRIQTLTIEAVEEHSLRAAIHFFGQLQPSQEHPNPEDLYIEGHSYFGFKEGKIASIQDKQGPTDALKKT